MPQEGHTWNRATEQVFPPSHRPHVRSHFYVAKLFEFVGTLPWVRQNEQRRSMNENRKSNEDEAVVVSRKLDVLQPTEQWNLKHPANTELLNPAKDTLPEKKSLTLQPSDGQSIFFFSYKHWQKLCTARQREHCGHYIVKIQTLYYTGYSVWSHSTSLSYHVTAVWNILYVWLLCLFTKIPLSNKVLKIHFIWYCFVQV